MIRRLIVNADDFGFTRDVNRGIVEAHTQGIFTATTLMANGAAFDDAVSLAREHRSLDIGVHAVLIQGRSTMPSGHALPANFSELASALLLRRLHPYEELRSQVERVCEAGLTPTHLDTHKHTHILPPVLDALCRLSEEFQLPWIRRPFDFPLEGSIEGIPWRKRMISRCMSGVRGGFHRKLSRHGCRTTDWFAGFQLTGAYHAAELICLLQQLPAGTTEFMCHPGLCTDELRSMPTRLKESRQAELRALTDASVRAALQKERIELTDYRRLSA